MKKEKKKKKKKRKMNREGSIENRKTRQRK